MLTRPVQHLTTSTGDLSVAASATQRHSSITGASVPASSVSTPTPTRSGNGPKGNTCKVTATVAANVLTFNCQHGPQFPRGGDNYAEIANIAMSTKLDVSDEAFCTSLIISHDQHSIPRNAYFRFAVRF
ncbi:hypothetical protein ZHAS_00020552 [Anopheles sinensis]|uniref:Uncharacterized protein n=1 Tax=Anopheles sinensis TaxID=74873 RepID=A0A084WQ46_ANOSI|nr:hypothetical protein ZHAS_00020552 [Anopheles sinensis]